MNLEQFKWTRRPKEAHISGGKIEIVTSAHTDLWQRTYYGFQNDNAPMLQMQTEENYFTFTVKAVFSELSFGECLWRTHDGQPPQQGSVTAKVSSKTDETFLLYDISRTSLAFHTLPLDYYFGRQYETNE